jgi:hypothetical protein
MLAEKLLALLAAFALGGVATLFLLTRSVAFTMHHSSKMRARIREAVDEAERDAQEDSSE